MKTIMKNAYFHLYEDKNTLVLKILYPELDYNNLAMIKRDTEVIEKITFQKFSILILDVSDLIYMDSTGLGLIVSLRKICHKKGSSMRLCGMQDSIKKLMELSSIIKIFDVHDTLENALMVN